MLFVSFLIYLIVSFTIGMLLIVLPFKLQDLPFIVKYFETLLISDPINGMISGLLGILIIMGCLWMLNAILIKPRKEKSLTFESPTGKVSISFFALEDMLKKMLEEKSEIVNAKPRVWTRKKEIIVNLRTNLAAEVNLVDFTKELQEKIKEKLQHLLGEDKEIKIHVEIRKMRIPSAKNRENPEDKEEPEVPFRNY